MLVALTPAAFIKAIEEMLDATNEAELLLAEPYDDLEAINIVPTAAIMVEKVANSERISEGSWDYQVSEENPRISHGLNLLVMSGIPKVGSDATFFDSHPRVSR